MKKLLLLLAASVSTFAYAQMKDIQLTLIKPTNGQQIISGQQFDLEYEVKNLGAGTVAMSDSIIVVAFLGTSQLNPPLGLFTQRTMNPGDTIHRSMKLTINFTPGTNTSATFCLRAFAQNGASIDSFQTNNTGCASTTLYNSVQQLEASNATVKVYPNPAREYVTIETDYSKASSISIFDITGKVVESVAMHGSETRIDLVTYRNGVYMYQLKSNTGDVIRTGKFSVAK